MAIDAAEWAGDVGPADLMEAKGMVRKLAALAKHGLRIPGSPSVQIPDAPGVGDNWKRLEDLTCHFRRHASNKAIVAALLADTREVRWQPWRVPRWNIYVHYNDKVLVKYL